MGKMTPTSPVYAHHRLLKELVRANHGSDKLEPKADEFDKVAQVFKRAGGSWVRLYRGSVKDLALLRKVLKIAVKKGHVSKAPEWEA
jgi:hypothetical protein